MRQFEKLENEKRREYNYQEGSSTRLVVIRNPIALHVSEQGDHTVLAQESDGTVTEHVLGSGWNELEVFPEKTAVELTPEERDRLLRRYLEEEADEEDATDVMGGDGGEGSPPENPFDTPRPEPITPDPPGRREPRRFPQPWVTPVDEQTWWPYPINVGTDSWEATENTKLYNDAEETPEEFCDESDEDYVRGTCPHHPECGCRSTTGCTCAPGYVCPECRGE